MRIVLLSFVVFAFVAAQDINHSGPQAKQLMTPDQAAAAEAGLISNPDDVGARSTLLGYYWLRARMGKSSPADNAASLNHLLWLIEHRPETAILAAPPATLPPGGPNELVSQAWTQALTTHANDSHVLANAAWFYRVADKQQSLDLLRRALALNPEDRQIAARLGSEYALILAGPKDLDEAGRPSRFDPVEAGSSLAQSVRAELEQSTQAAVLDAAGAALNSYADEMRRAGVDAGDLVAYSNRLSARARMIDPALAPQRIRVGGNVQAANLLKKVDPTYPALAAQARIQGTVRFTVLIATDGTVENVQLVSGHPLLVGSAVEAVKQWVYKPTLLNGVPVAVTTSVDVSFILPEVKAQP